LAYAVSFTSGIRNAALASAAGGGYSEQGLAPRSKSAVPTGTAADFGYRKRISESERPQGREALGAKDVRLRRSPCNIFLAALNGRHFTDVETEEVAPRGTALFVRRESPIIRPSRDCV